MKKFVSALLTVLALLTFSAGVALADTSTPFNPQLVGTVSVSPAGNSQQVQKWTLMAKGSQAPLGDFAYQSELVVHIQNGLPAFAQGHGTFTGVGTSSGDSISFTLNLTFGSPEANNPNMIPFTGTFTVTSGTGRFQGVTGSGTIPQGGANIANDTFFGNWDGFVVSKSG